MPSVSPAGRRETTSPKSPGSVRDQQRALTPSAKGVVARSVKLETRRTRGEGEEE